MSLSADFPAMRPTLLLNFARARQLDPRITFTRASTATYFDSSGVLQTAIAGQPRFDFNPTTLQSLGLLIEEQRTNSIRNNTMQGAVAGTPGTLPTNWAGITTVSGVNREIVGVGTQNGVSYIDIRYSGTTTATTFNNFVAMEPNTFVVASNGQSWTSSSWVAVVGGSTANLTFLGLRTRFNDSGGVELTSSNVNLLTATNQLQRFNVTATASSASTAFVATVFSFQFNSGVAIDITLRIGLPQLELGAFATSVIPTTVAAATRNADVASMTGTNFSSWYNATEGTLYSEASTYDVGAARATFYINDGSTSNRIQTNNGSGAKVFIATNGTTELQQTNFTGVTYANNVFAKVGLAYKQNDGIGAVNGVIGTLDTVLTVPVVNEVKFGQISTINAVLNGHIRRIAYYPVRLSNDQLQALTR